MFIHFLITRFNIKISGAGPERMTSESINEQWLKDRLFFFKSYCAPSVFSQTNKNFIWLLYFDSLTPEYIREELVFLKINSPGIKIVFVTDYNAMIDDIRLKIKDTITPYVISSRLDNDESLVVILFSL